MFPCLSTPVAILLGNVANVICEKAAHHKPTNKKDNLAGKVPSVIPNHSGFNTKKKQIICSNTLPIYPYAKH